MNVSRHENVKIRLPETTKCVVAVESVPFATFAHGPSDRIIFELFKKQYTY